MFGWFKPKFPALKEKADKAFAHKEYAEAMRLYEEALERAEKEPEEVVKAVKARANESRDLLAKERLADAKRLLSQGMHDEAYELAEIARDRAHSEEIKKEAEALLAKLDDAGEEEEQEAPDEAPKVTPEERLETHIESAPKPLQESYKKLGEAFRDAVLEAYEGDPAKAVTLLAPFVEKELAARYERGGCRLILEDFNGAIEDLEAVADALDEDDPAVLRRLVGAYRDRAISRKDISPLRLTPRLQAEEHPTKKPSQETLDDLEQASEYLTTLLEANEHDHELYRALIEVFLLRGDLSKARRAAEVGLQKITTPQLRQSICAGLGRVEAAAGQWEHAEDALEQAVQLSWGLDSDTKLVKVERESAWLLTRILIDRNQRLDRALDLLRALQMRATDEEHHIFLLSEGEILAKQGKKKEGLRKMEEALDEVPPNGPEAERIKKSIQEFS